MDFSFTEEQEAVRELAAQIFSDLSTPERLKQVEASRDEAVRPQACGASSPPPGCSASPSPRTSAAPASASSRPASWPRRPGAPRPTCPWSRPWSRRRADRRVRHRRAAQGLAAGVVAGETVLTAALVELVGEVSARRHRPTTTATAQPDGVAAHGTKACVPAAWSPTPCWCPRRAGHRRHGTGVGVFVVDPAPPASP